MLEGSCERFYSRNLLIRKKHHYLKIMNYLKFAISINLPGTGGRDAEIDFIGDLDGGEF